MALSSIINRFTLKIRNKIEKLIRETQNPSTSQQIQRSISSQWLMAKRQNIKLFDNVKDSGFRCYSQFEEDGIILYILTIIGVNNRTVVEICCGTGSECMAANLIINHGFKGYLFDGDQKNVDKATSFFNKQQDCLLVKPNIVKAWITRDNINKLLIDAGIEGEVDVLSIDIDGNDYYIWEAIKAINPRMCVFETHDIVPCDKSITIPYSDNFFAMDKKDASKDFRSVSLAAMDKLSRSKGYTLVGGHRHGFNVFYVRNDLLNDLLPRPTLGSIHDNEWTRAGQAMRWPKVKDFPWVEV